MKKKYSQATLLVILSVWIWEFVPLIPVDGYFLIIRWCVTTIITITLFMKALELIFSSSE
jgi:hypothetical protein